MDFTLLLNLIFYINAFFHLNVITNIIMSTWCTIIIICTVWCGLCASVIDTTTYTWSSISASIRVTVNQTYFCWCLWNHLNFVYSWISLSGTYHLKSTSFVLVSGVSCWYQHYQTYCNNITGEIFGSIVIGSDLYSKCRGFICNEKYKKHKNVMSSLCLSIIYFLA